MSNTKSNVRNYFIAFLIILLSYITLSLVVPPDLGFVDRYNLNDFQRRLVSLAIVAPVTIIYLTAFYGFAKFKTYTDSIKDHPDGNALSIVSTGFGILSLGLPLSSFITALNEYLAKIYPQDAYAYFIASGFINMMVAATAYFFIWRGSTALKKVTPIKSSTVFNIAAVSIILIMTFAFIYEFTVNPAPLVVGGQHRLDFSTTELAFAIIKDTLYLGAWFLGLLAASNIFSYAASVEGIIYKKAFSLLSLGIFTVILSSILTQSLSFFNDFFARLNLGAVLLVVFILLIFILVGYILIALGAKKLQKIEIA